MCPYYLGKDMQFRIIIYAFHYILHIAENFILNPQNLKALKTHKNEIKNN